MRKRTRSIDLMKIILVLGMVLDHIIQLTYKESNAGIYQILKLITKVINLVTFPGFLFCFGFAVAIAYLRKSNEKITRIKIVKNALRILAAFYISGFAMELLVEKKASISTLVEVITLTKIPRYSEFLVSFFMITLLTAIFLNTLKKITSNIWLTLLYTVIAMTFILTPYKSVTIAQIGILIGTIKFNAFPVIQYSIYYIWGAYFYNKGIKRNVLVILTTGISFFLFWGSTLYNGETPERYPLSLLWLLGASLFIYVLYLISDYFTAKYKIKDFCFFIGENPLAYLVFSNLILFFMVHYGFYISSILVLMGIYLLIISLCTILILIYNNLNKFIKNGIWGYKK